MIEDEIQALNRIAGRYCPCDGRTLDPTDFQTAVMATIAALEKLDERITSFEYRELHKSTSDNP